MGESLRSQILASWNEREQYVIWELVEMLAAQPPEVVAAFLANPYAEED